jgi:DNA processing protein
MLERMDALDLQLALGRVHGLTAARLSALFDSIDDGTSPCRSLARLAERSSAVRTLLGAVDTLRIRADRDWVTGEGIHLLDRWSPDYPAQLGATAEAPALLYVKGDPASVSSVQLAMVGSRRPTPSGARTALEFARQLAGAGLTITSGLALGIDTASHEGALAAGGRTLAVLGSGLDEIYPHEQRTLAALIATRGALISELPPGCAPRRHHFPLRNRIISGLARAVLVVEAAQRSGSLITARQARLQGRAVFAVPGSIHNPLARGCHALIRDGAALVENPAQILRGLLDINIEKQSLMIPGGARELPPTLDKDYKILLDAVGFEPTGIDTLVVRTGFPSHSVASMLLTLELEGAVGILADGQYVRL